MQHRAIAQFGRQACTGFHVPLCPLVCCNMAPDGAPLRQRGSWPIGGTSVACPALLVASAAISILGLAYSCKHSANLFDNNISVATKRCNGGTQPSSCSALRV
jgi:hypothetical protein